MQRFVIILALLFVLSPWARAESIALILSDDSPPFKEFAARFQETLKGSDWRINYQGTALQNKSLIKFDLIITAGGEALRSVIDSKPKAPVLAALITEANFRTLHGNTRSPPEITAIVLDQPASRQARLIHLLFPQAKQVGMLFGPQTISQSETFRKALSRHQLQLNVDSVSNQEQIVPAIDHLISRSDVLLAHPDTAIYSRNTIKPILMTAYRHRRPVVAFSSALAKAGAVAALYSTPGQIGEQTGKYLLSRKKSDTLVLLPTSFSISINQSVAESFGLRLPDENDLLQKLFTAESS